MEKVRIAVLGATGYSGAEAVRLVSQHPGVTLTLVTADQHAGTRLADVHPFLRDCALQLEPVEPARVRERADVAISALPEPAAAAVVPALVRSGVRVIDMSAAFRLKNDEIHRQWYHADPAPDLRRGAVYGLTELRRAEIRDAVLVANPGCYPTGVLLALAPLLRRGMVGGPIVVDAKSGVSGARRKGVVEQLFCEVNENCRAYAVADHRHGPEMEQEIEAFSGRRHQLLFAPHLVPVNRGILATIYAPLAPGAGEEVIGACLREAYAAEPFVVLCGNRWPELREVRGTNLCAIGWKVDVRTGWAILVTVLDNLGKGAAGQALQNLNAMCGFPETEGLLGTALVP